MILCIIIDRTGIGPAIAIGTNSTRGVDDAVRGALLEAVQIRHFSRRIHLEEKVGNIVGFFEKRALKWYRLESLELLDFIFSSDEYSNPKDYSGTEEDFLDSFLHDLYYSDVTLPGMKGYKVVKVNVPDLLPLYFSDEHKPIFGKRVQGYLGGQPINDVPHPFL